MSSKRILVIGGTGAQGHAVVKALLESKTPTFNIRILTRDPENAGTKSKYPPSSGVELFKGSFMDIDSVYAALQDCYGIYVNTDGNAVKEADEIWAAMRIFETAKRIPTLRHFVWSGLDYVLKNANYDPAYAALHVNAKARVNEWLRSQESSTAENGLTWSIVNSGPYMEMLHGGTYVPEILADGTRLYAFPLGTHGRLPLIALPDLAFFATLLFQNRSTWSGQTISVVSAFASGEDIASTLTKVTGLPAVYKACSYDEWADSIPWVDTPQSKNDPNGPTKRDNYRMWWKGYEDNLYNGVKDLQRLRGLHPQLRTLEGWMRETGYDGSRKPLLKLFADGMFD